MAISRESSNEILIVIRCYWWGRLTRAYCVTGFDGDRVLLKLWLRSLWMEERLFWLSKSSNWTS